MSTQTCARPTLAAKSGVDALSLVLVSIALLTSPPLLLSQPSPPAQPLTPTLVGIYNAPYQASRNYVRLGAPITFSGRILQADATGTLTFSVPGLPDLTLPLSPQTPGDYIAFGDDSTYAGYIGDPTQRYQGVIAQDLNLNVSTFATPGYTTCDILFYDIIGTDNGIFPGANPLYSLASGSDDAFTFGIGSHEQLFNLCYQAALSWLGTSRPSKILAGDSGVSVQSGSWTNVGAFGNCCVNLLTNTTGSGTIRFTMSSGGSAAYLWYALQASALGTFAVSVDSGPYGTPVQTQFDDTGDNQPGTYAMLRLPVAAGAHTFDITAQSGTVSILGMGSSPATGSATQTPTVLASDIPNNTGNASAAVAEYTSDIEANIALLRQDNLDIRFVQTQKHMFGTPAELIDTFDPNALGLSEMAQAFEAVVTPTAPAADTISVTSAGFSTSTLPVGGNLVTLRYSGDSKYAPAVAGVFVAIYDGSSSTALTSDAAIYSLQTPITLTASIPQANDSGLVSFYDITDGSNTLLGTVLMSPGPQTAQLVLPSLPAGAHTIVAQYLGDVHYWGSTSAPIQITVSGSYTWTALATPTTSVYAGIPVPLKATVNPWPASGTVSFMDGANILAQVPVVDGVALYTIDTLAIGTHALTATFSGNATLDSSSSPALSIQINPNPTTISLAPVPAQMATGTPLTLSASVNSAAGAYNNLTGRNYSAYGDSITFGIMAAAGEPYTYVGVFKAKTGIADSGPGIQNRGYPADMAGDMVNKIFNFENASAYSNILYSTMIGTNDLDHRGVGTYEPVFSQLNEAAVAWLATVSDMRVDAGSVVSSGWSADKTYAAVTGAQSSTQGASIDYKLTTYGNPVYVWPRLIDGNAGTFSISIDGNIVVPNVNCFAMIRIATSNGSTQGVGFVRIPIAPGSHTITYTVTSPSGPGNLVGIVSTGTAPKKGTLTTPTVLVGGVIPHNANYHDSVVLPTQQYTLDVLNSIAPLQADGLDVRYVDTPASMQGGLPYFYGDFSFRADTTDGSPILANVSSPMPFSFSESFNVTSPSLPAPTTVHAGTVGCSAESPVNCSLTLNENATTTATQVTFSGQSTYDWLHPYDAGHYALGVAFANVALASAPVAATGTVTFSDSFVPLTSAGSQGTPQVATLGQQPLSSGMATLTATNLAPGTHTLSAIYSGDSNHLAAVSSAQVTQVVLAPSAINLTPIPPTAPYQSTVALTASVSPSAATGTVTFADSATGTLASVPLVNGTTSFSTSALAIGPHTLSATYSGDAGHAASASPAVVSTTIVQIASSVTLAPFPALLQAGTPLAFTAAITPASATGSVTFHDPTFGVLGQSPVTHGTAALTLTNPALGSYAITATYSGDANDSPATSAAVITQVGLTSTVTTLTASASTAPVGASVTLNAAITSASATGSVTFFDGASTLGTAILANAKANLTIATLAVGTHSLRAVYSGDSLDASSSATFLENITTDSTTTALSVAQASIIAGAPLSVNVRVTGPYAAPSGTVTLASGATNLGSATLANAAAGSAYATITLKSAPLGLGTSPLSAFYSGDTNDQPSSSLAASVTVLGIPTAATLTLSANQIPIQASATLTAAVTSATGVPGGSVVFSSNGTALATLPLTTAGTAAYTFTPAAVAGDSILATYVPTGLFAASTSPAEPLTVTPPLTASLNPAAISATPGATTTVNLNLTPLSGYSGPIQTTCQTSISFVTCTVAAPANLSNSVTTPVKITISTSSAALTIPAKATATALLALLLPLLRRRRPNALRFLTLLLTCALASTYLAGCAEGGDFNSVPAGAQTVAVSVTAAGLTQVATLTVNVMQ